MRISIEKTDALGYANFEAMRGHDLAVTRDGIAVDVRALVSADEEEGSIVRLQQYDSGEIAMPDGQPVRLLEYGEVKITATKRPYDAGTEIREHQDDVRQFMQAVIVDLHARASVHDDSKFSAGELPFLQKLGELTEKEGKAAIGTPQYEERKALLGPMIEHHYANNDHHPEHHQHGMFGMTLMSLVEMFCDGAAANKRRDGGAPMNITHSVDKYEIPPMLESILRNTAIALGIAHK